MMITSYNCRLFAQPRERIRGGDDGRARIDIDPG